MKKLFALLFTLIAWVSVDAQVSSTTAKKIVGTTTLPATCTAGPNPQVYIDTNATAAAQFYVCTSTNTWTLQTGGAGSGSVTSVSVVSANGQSGTVATATTTPAITLNNPSALVVTTSATSPLFRGADGVVGTPSYSFTNDTNTGVYHAQDADTMDLVAGGAAVARVYNTATDGIDLRSDGQLRWSNSTIPAGTVTADTGFSRPSAGVVEINSGTTGTLRDLSARAFTFNGATQTLSNAAFANCTAITTVSNVLGCTASDIRLKQNLRPFTDGLNFIRNVTPRTYSFKEGTRWYDNDRTRLGLVAQEVAPFLPNAVFPIGPNQPLQIDYQAVTAATIDAIKTLDARITALESENKRLRKLLKHKR